MRRYTVRRIEQGKKKVFGPYETVPQTVRFFHGLT
jgi:hypothetical protein